MERDDDTGRTEPTFGHGQSGGGQAESDVDFDELFAEIDKSVADSFSTPAPEPTPQEERWVDELTTPPEIDDDESEPLYPESTPLPAQPTFDFGADNELLTAASPQQGATEPPIKTNSGEEAMSRGMLMAGGALVALSVLLGAAGMMVGWSASSKIDALQQSVSALQNKLSTLQVSGDPRVGQLQAEQAGIASRLDEMNTRLDALSSKGGEDTLVSELNKRVEALEHKAATTPARSSTTAKNSEPKKTAIKHTATNTRAIGSGDWTVILVSFTQSSQADTERSRVQRLGYPTDVVKTLVDGKAWYRVRILGFQSHEAATAAIPAIEKKTKINGIWVSHR